MFHEPPIASVTTLKPRDQIISRILERPAETFTVHTMIDGLGMPRSSVQDAIKAMNGMGYVFATTRVTSSRGGRATVHYRLQNPEHVPTDEQRALGEAAIKRPGKKKPKGEGKSNGNGAKPTHEHDHMVPPMLGDRLHVKRTAFDADGSVVVSVSDGLSVWECKVMSRSANA